MENARWLNHTPLSKKDLLGKIVLLDFFTYCCINCLNVLAELKTLEKEFASELIVIGVHAGKHPHEKEDASILDAMKRCKIEHCVINDADLRLWDGYGIKAWPTLVLIDPQGYVVAQHQGEGHMQTLRSDIRSLIVKHTLDTKHFNPVCGREENHLLKYPQKIVTSDKYLFIAHLDEVLVCSYEGAVLHKISDILEPQGMVYIQDRLYIASCEGKCIVEVSEAFSHKNLWLEGLRNPYALASDGKSLFVSLAGAHQIKAYDLQTKEELLVIGQENSESLNDGRYEEAVLAQPSGISLLEEELWFVDSESSSLRCAVYGEVRSHIFDCDELQHPLDLCVGLYGDGCGGGRIFIVDSYNNAIKVYDPESKTVITLMEGLSEPSGISKKGCQLFIANTNAHEVVTFDLSKMQKTILELRG
jgi:thiol-disulfide isomerase/thioredoxin